MRRIFLVSCVSRKSDRRELAKDLYRSPWFKKARAYTEEESDCWYILSAKHELLEPDTPVEPYDLTLNKMSVNQRRDWGARVAEQLRKILKPDDQLTVLAGSKYTEFLLPGIRGCCAGIEMPLKGLRIGEQLSWLGSKACE